MKIMWVTMAAIGRAAHMFYDRKVQSGGWIDATHESLKPYIENNVIELHIVAIGASERMVYDEETKTMYHMVKAKCLRGRATPKSEAAVWKKIVDEIKPDLIQIWGTEFTFGEIIRDVVKDVPVCYYIQGVANVLSQHPAGDVPLKQLFFQSGIMSIFKFRSMLKEIGWNKKQGRIEAEMLKNSDGIIVDNMWTEAQYFLLTDKFYNVPLAINEKFFKQQWAVQNCVRSTIFTVAGGSSPIKGIHNVVLAVARLKAKYPNIKLKIPGNISSAKPHFLYDTIFIRHIRRLIKKYGLEDNVVFLGQLAAEEMIDQLCKANVFVMPSCVETHSSSLREAMVVGCPVVTAAVGSIFEFVAHDKNGFLYRYDDVESIAYFIDRLFSDDVLATRLSACAKETVRQKYPQEKIGEMLIDAYSGMVNINC